MDRRNVIHKSPKFWICRDCGKRFIEPPCTSGFIPWTPCCPGCGGRRVETLAMALERQKIKKIGVFQM